MGGRWFRTCGRTITTAAFWPVGQLAQVIATDAHVTLSDELPNPPPVRQQPVGRRSAEFILFILRDF